MLEPQGSGISFGIRGVSHTGCSTPFIGESKMKKIFTFLLIIFFIIIIINCDNNPTAITHSIDTLYIVNNDTIIIKDTIYVIDSVNSKYYIQEGIITADMYTSTGTSGFWSIPSFFGSVDSIVIQTFVSLGPGYIWIVPDWGLDKLSIRIFEDGLVATGWQYRIVGVYRLRQSQNTD